MSIYYAAPKYCDATSRLLVGNRQVNEQRRLIDIADEPPLLCETKLDGFRYFKKLIFSLMI
jgi:hypothetical protein